MTIKRKINNMEIEIELTSDELFEAYREQEHEWDLESCDTYFHTMYACEEWYENLDEETQSNIIEDAAYQLRRNINKYDMYFDYAMTEAFADVLPNYIKEEEQ